MDPLLEYAVRLVAASICGALIGLEREKRSKNAGIRTHIIVALASALISWGISLLRNWLNTKINDEKLKQYMNQFFDAVLSAVKAVDQTYVDDLKKQGKFDLAAQKAALCAAKEMALAELSDDAKEMLEHVFADLGAKTETQIESTLYDLKKGKNTKMEAAA